MRAISAIFVFPLQGSRSLWLIFLFLMTCLVEVHAQVYVAEVEGIWKTKAGVNVTPGAKLRAGLQLTNSSGSRNDHLSLVDANANVVVRATCINGCPPVVVPKTESWGTFFYCMIIKCGSTRYSTSGTRNDCENPDLVVKVDLNGRTDVSSLLPYLSNDSGTVVRLSRRLKKSVIQQEFTLSSNQITIEGLTEGIYEVTAERKTSRILVLSNAVYEREQKGLDRFQQKIKDWRDQELNDCTIKRFSSAFIDYVLSKQTKAASKRQAAGRTKG